MLKTPTSLVTNQNNVVKALCELKINDDATQQRHLFDMVSQAIAALVYAETDMVWDIDASGWTGDRKAAVTKFHPTRPTIAFSKAFMLEADLIDCVEVIFHEVAHAIAGEEAGHGLDWKAACTRLSISGAERVAKPARL